MANHTLLISNIAELDKKANKFLELIGENRILAFYGDMGVGKTTFIKALCKVLNVTDEVTSPTFAIVNEYFTKHDYKIYHFDFYRIKKENEIFDFGYEEYLYSKNYCMIEWPEIIECLLPEKALRIFITMDNDGNRILNF